MMDNRPFEECECGFRVRGNSQAHAKANLKNHKKSKLHKNLMEAKNE